MTRMRIIVVAVVLLVAAAAGYVWYAWHTPELDDAAYVQQVQHMLEEQPSVPDIPTSDGVHTSIYYPKSFFDSAYKRTAHLTMPRAAATLDRANIRGVLIPHHLLAGQYIAQTVSGLEDAPIDTIIVLSPDHFAHGREWASASGYTWQTPYGDLHVAGTTLQNLLAAGVVSVDEKPFTAEHGITGIMPFLARTFPHAKVVPIIVREDMPSAQADALGNVIRDALDEHTLLVGSFDFSHYLPQRVAAFHDATAATVLEQLDTDGTARLDIDSKPGLRVFLRALHGMQWHPIAHTSSDELLKKPDSFDNTSYFTGYYTAGSATTTSRVTIHAFGDIMLDRTVRTILATKGPDYPLEQAARFMDGSDIVLANLENPVTTNASKARPGGPLIFTADPKYLPMLKKHGVSVVSLANNHTLNFGAEGLAQTKLFLKQNNIAYFGDPNNRTELSHIETVHGMRIGFIGFHQFINNDPRIVSDEIRRIHSQTDFIIVMPHWGVEYETDAPRESQVRAAHAWIDAGADVIIGAHPHVVQPAEEYKGKMIFYSLGNFVFDQQFSEDVKTELSLGIVVEPRQVTYHLFPMYNEGVHVAVSEQQRRDILLTNLASHSAVNDRLRKEIQSGEVILTR